jgi:hypothetical protein
MFSTCNIKIYILIINIEKNIVRLH